MTRKPTCEELEQKVKDLERTESMQKESAFGEATRSDMAAALRESEEKYRTLVEESFDGIFIQKGPKIVFANRRLHEMLGYPDGALEGEDHWVVYHPDYQAITRERGQARMRGEEVPSQYEVKLQRKDGSQRDIAFRSVKLETGEVLVIYEDTTEQKRMEAQLLQAQKIEAVGTLTGGIAHDFNNSLQGILGYTQIMLMDLPKDAPEVSKLRHIEAVAMRASELTKQLLTFSRKVESRLRPVDLNQEVRQVEKLLRRTIPRMIDIELVLRGDLHIIHADAAQIEQVMMNLGINARDAMPNGGKLTIETENVLLDEAYCRAHLGVAPGEYVMLSLSDNGVGMDKETLEHIFEPFYTTKAVGSGTGLGLAMVYGIVKSHKGSIMCYSEPGEGTIFRLYFPVAEEDRVRHPEEQEKAEIRGGNETILLVDDESFIRELAEDMLRRFGYAVITAADGETALEIYREKKAAISLVILDLIMPGMGGEKCLEAILEINPSQKVVIASGYSPNGSTRQALKRCARAYAKKPYDVRPMMAMVREILDQERV